MLSAERLYQKTFQAERVEDPGIIKTIFGSPKVAPVWAVLRIYLGWQWLAAGLHKVNDPNWTRSGTALKGFWANAVKIDPGQKGAVIHYGWYHDFLQYMLNHQWYTWFGKLIAFGETAIGIALIVGAFVGIAAFFGATMNLNFMLAGSASTNPALFGIAVLLILGWKVAGFIGADYYLLQFFGTPWKLGRMTDVAHDKTSAERTAASFGIFAVIFGVAGVLAVVASNQFNADHPVVGGVIAAAVVVAAWAATEAAVFATHTFGRGGILRPLNKTSAPA